MKVFIANILLICISSVQIVHYNITSYLELSQIQRTAIDCSSYLPMYGGELIACWLACNCVFSTRVLMTAIELHMCFFPQVENTKATSRCGLTRGGTHSLEKQTLCTRGVTGRWRRGRTGACVLIYSNPGTYPGSNLTSSDGELRATGHSWLMSTMWSFVRVCMSHTLSCNTPYLQM